MLEFTPVAALIGGAMIGLSAVLLMRFNGRIAGVSGIAFGALRAVAGDRAWRVAFVLGLVAGGLAYQLASGEALISREGFSIVQLIAAGLLVGVGTHLGSGCTSGHGVCGSARLSPRSIVATLTFVAVGAVTATLLTARLAGGA